MIESDTLIMFSLDWSVRIHLNESFDVALGHKWCQSIVQLDILSIEVPSLFPCYDCLYQVLCCTIPHYQ